MGFTLVGPILANFWGRVWLNYGAGYGDEEFMGEFLEPLLAGLWGQLWRDYGADFGNIEIIKPIMEILRLCC